MAVEDLHPSDTITIRVDALATVSRKARQAGWEVGHGDVTDEYADRYLRNVLDEWVDRGLEISRLI